MRAPLSLLAALLVGCGDKSGSDTAGLEDTSDDTGADTDDTPTDPDEDGDGYLRSVDCDDTNAAVRPDADEVCNGIDDNCDGRIDDEDPELSEAGALLRHPDADGDGYGDPALDVWVCLEQAGRVADDTDCDDTRSDVHPDAVEVCNEVDDDCDGLIDDEDINIKLSTTQTFYADTDGDRFGDPAATDQACRPPTGYVLDSTDCDDSDPLVSPEGQEVCNGIDDDCDDLLDDGDDSLDARTTTPWFWDADGDGYGSTVLAGSRCAAPTGTVADSTDCDDTVATTYPGATEHCDDVDSDCDPSTAEDGLITRSGTSTYTDLATALAAARRGDTLVLCDGTYAGEVTISAAVTLRSLHGADYTTIAGSGLDSVLSIAETVTLEGLTITGGDATDGGGIDAYTASAGHLTVRDCVIEDNAAVYGGGISAPYGYQLLVYDTLIRDNVASLLGGGIYMIDGSLEGVLLEGNEALNGGGLYVDSGRATLDADTLLRDNVASGTTSGTGVGGGLLGYDAVLLLDPDTLLTGNVAEYGGGAYLVDASWADGGLLEDNEATEEGGGLFLTGSRCSVEDIVITDNIALYGGGISADASAFTLTDSTISSNSASDYGGGVFVYASTKGTLEDTELSSNLADYGAGLMAYGTTVALTSTALLDNRATYAGGGLYVYDSAAALSTCDVEGNRAGEVGGGASLEDGSLTSIASDWGVSTSDNSPDDVFVWDISTAYSSYGGAASFSCPTSLSCR